MTRTLAAAGGLALLGASRVEAHGFGQRYDLPVPLTLYLAGAGAAVALSFLVMGLFVRRAESATDYPRLNLLRWRAVEQLTRPGVLGVVKAVALGLFCLVVITGVFGTQSPIRNLAPTMVWVIWWVGLAYVCALLGNLWVLVNPWRTAFMWIEALSRRTDPESSPSLGLSYPARLGVWPGVLLFFAFAWIELVSNAGRLPATLALLALAYAGLMGLGMFLFGRETWLRHGDAFTLAFGLLARFAPTEIRVRASYVCGTCPVECRDLANECVDCPDCFRRAAPHEREWNLRPFAAGLQRPERVGLPLTTFVVLMLATVTFDGLLETPLWGELRAAMFAALPDLWGWRLAVTDTIGLLSVPLLLGSAYLVVLGLMKQITAGVRARHELTGLFVFSLVPIAIGYHLAHYLSFLLIQGQLVIPLASDPFGFGWNLLGTARYRLDIGIIDARFVWYTAVIAIVLGHVIAVYLAHHVALRAYSTSAAALRSQYPMLMLMVGYTMVSLWILAQPIVEMSPTG